ncbi:hypothetical protein AVEN_142500-1 [Araneus ventricosus]|uniref:Uncharacterized protein n=1 Tax=Araneus ventricosus TaxID=182803 RepID=A0A4Y2Q589_ARAVE|nr:hypothetical protein AVEN_142500-1 [Araneus ventricosus]
MSSGLSAACVLATLPALPFETVLGHDNPYSTSCQPMRNIEPNIMKIDPAVSNVMFLDGPIVDFRPCDKTHVVAPYRRSVLCDSDVTGVGSAIYEYSAGGRQIGPPDSVLALEPACI